MATKTITLNEIFVELKKLSVGWSPIFAIPWNGAVETLKTTATSLSIINSTIFSIPIPELPDPADPSQPVSPGGDPVKPLESIANAIASAENIFNEDNLVISQASVEVNMNVNVPGIAGANTTIKFGVEPRPQ